MTIPIRELELIPLSPGRLGCQAAEQQGGGIRLSFEGTAESPDRPQLTRLLEDLHAESRKRKLSDVWVDVKELKFLNSSCFKDFVTWLNRVLELPVAERYRIHFVSNPSVRWQQGSLHALSSFAPEIASIE